MVEKTFSHIDKEPRERVTVGQLAAFDLAYFQSLEGEDGWIAMGDEYYHNAQYFTVMSEDGEKLGIIGVYDTADEKNISHTVVDPKFRGQGLATKFKDKLMEKLNLPYLTLTISLSNEPSLRAAAKLSGVRRVSDEAYEAEYDKAKFVYYRSEGI